MKFLKGFIAALCLLIGVACGLYAGVGYFYYEDRFFKNTYINGIDCSGLKAEEAEQLIGEQVRQYTLTLVRQDQTTEELDAAQMDYQYVPQGEIQNLLEEQKPLEWEAYFQGKKKREEQFDPKISYDAKKLRQSMDQLECFQDTYVQKPKDAYLSDNGKEWEIVLPDDGNELDEEVTWHLVQSSVDNKQSRADFAAGGCYKKAAVRENDEYLNTRKDLLNRYRKMTITYEFAKDPMIIDQAFIQSWVSIDENNQVVVSTGKLTSFVKDLASKYDTLGTMEQVATTAGTIISLESRTYGWLVDQEAECKALEQILRTGESVTRSPIYSESALERNEMNDIGDTYVEIDYSKQHLWFYKGGKLLTETDVVTGNVSAGNASPEGIFCIVYKEKNATLKGEGYSSPVSFWMPFFEGVGIHDATWRYEFGGSIYQYSGSHGCINAPYDSAKKIFENIDEGTPVICYSSDTAVVVGEVIGGTGDTTGDTTDTASHTGSQTTEDSAASTYESEGDNDTSTYDYTDDNSASSYDYTDDNSASTYDYTDDNSASSYDYTDDNSASTYDYTDDNAEAYEYSYDNDASAYMDEADNGFTPEVTEEYGY